MIWIEERKKGLNFLDMGVVWFVLWDWGQGSLVHTVLLFLFPFVL